MLNWPTIKVAKFSVRLLDIVSYADESVLTRSYTAVTAWYILYYVNRNFVQIRAETHGSGINY